ncbi:MAG: hypothetical protein E5299_02371 [Burkholderia gladioli]|nr:MAG: hypothetical protein E5299_02371 [Burkholderia gladioli]
MASTGILITNFGSIISGDMNGLRTSEVRNPFYYVLALDLCNNTACSNGRMAWFGVVGTVTADDIDLFVEWNLVEQLVQSVTVSRILMRH